jgi:hydrogenase expression/formation protein HypC
MCLAVPGKIVSIESTDAPAGGRVGRVEFHGSRVEASLAMTPEATVGDWVLVHAGFAIAQLDKDEARETFESLREALGEAAEETLGPGGQGP